MDTPPNPFAKPLKPQLRPGPRAALCSLIDRRPHRWLATRSATTSREKKHNTQGLPSVYTGTLRHELPWTCVGALHIVISSFSRFFSLYPGAELMSIRQSGPQASFIPLPTASCQSVVIPVTPRQPVEVRSGPVSPPSTRAAPFWKK